MSGPSATPPVLVIGPDAAARRELVRRIAPELRARELEPSQLGDPASFLDAAGAIAILGRDDGPDVLAGLESLDALPVREALVLYVDGAPEERIAEALDRLRPRQVLVQPVSDAVLRYALHAAIPATSPGRGARHDQRRAPVLLGVSRAMRDVLEHVKRVAPSGVPVLILGETGTGKELVARALHERSGRRDRPFVAVNCGALPETLLESELFGHRRGAFTGADRDKQGLFEQADGGTLFLDEIGDTPPSLQVKLLRVLETGEVRALGDTQERRVDVRLVSATHRDLERAVKEGEFRQDLFYRINTVSLHIPPLRRRRADIPFLAQHFAEEFGAENARRITLAEDFLDALGRCSFPGNVRELRNAVERAIALTVPEEPVTREALDGAPSAPLGPAPLATGTLRERIERLEIAAIRDALACCDGNRTRAAERLGLSRLGLRKKMQRLGIDEPEGR